MSNEHPNMNTNLNADDLCIAAMLRACADGELCPDECDRLKSYLAEHPDAAARVEFEKQLRGSCDRVLRQPVCPDALRAKIEAIASESATTSNIEASNEITKQKSFWQRSPMMSAMAAALVLAGGALIWQSASLITKNSGLGIVEPDRVAYAERVGNFVAREHMRCCQERAAKAKLIINDIDETTSYFEELFGRPVSSPSEVLDGSTIRFYGGGECHVPATSNSGHLRFDAADDSGQVVSLSLFIAPDPGILELEEGVTYLINSTHCKEQGANLFGWVRDGVLYLLVSEASKEMCASVRGMMQAPEQLIQL